MMQQALTLYVDLAPGAKPDMAVVGRSLVAFDQTVKELAFFIDPTIDIHLDFDSGTDGSLRLNSWLRSVRDDPAQRKRVIAILVGIAVWFADQTGSYFYEKLLDDLFPVEVQQNLSEEELREIQDDVRRALEGRIGEREAGQVYKELLADKRITGVGISPGLNQKPAYIVPRAEFEVRAKGQQEEEVEGAKRTIEEEATMILISPVLLSENRRWKFAYHGFEIGATIKDEDFLERVLHGLEPVTMAGGIRMHVILEIKQVREGEMWTNTAYAVKRVLNVEQNRFGAQSDLFRPEEED